PFPQGLWDVLHHGRNPSRQNAKAPNTIAASLAKPTRIPRCASLRSCAAMVGLVTGLGIAPPEPHRALAARFGTVLAVRLAFAGFTFFAFAMLASFTMLFGANRAGALRE